jgi:hypothetical protein
MAASFSVRTPADEMVTLLPLYQSEFSQHSEKGVRLSGI